MTDELESGEYGGVVDRLFSDRCGRQECVPLLCDTRLAVNRKCLKLIQSFMRSRQIEFAARPR